jgi:hypothetical protein
VAFPASADDLAMQLGELFASQAKLYARHAEALMEDVELRAKMVAASRAMDDLTAGWGEVVELARRLAHAGGRTLPPRGSA